MQRKASTLNTSSRDRHTTREKLTCYALIVAGSALIGAGAWTLLDELAIGRIATLISHLIGGSLSASRVDSFQRYAGDTIGRGALLAIAGLIVLVTRNHVMARSRAPGLWAAAAALALTVLWLPVAVCGHTAEISGVRFWWLFEDQMISMRFARNLATGAGLVWNVGERVEGYSNFLWTLYMSVVHLVPIPDSKKALAILLTNVGLAAATIPVVIRLVRSLGGGFLAVAATAAWFLLSKNIMYWTVEGTESALLTLLFLWSLSRVIAESRESQPRLATHLLIGTISLIRADGFVLSGLLYLLSFLVNGNKRVLLRFTLISLAIPACHLGFRVWYYGDLLPNTAHLKVFNWQGRSTAGFVYIAHFAVRYGLMLAVALIGTIVSRDRINNQVLILLVLYCLYVVGIGGDAFQDFRFLVPVLPMWAALAFLVLEKLRVEMPLRVAACTVVLISVPLIVSPSYLVYLTPVELNVGDVKLGRLIKLNTPGNASVADHRVGTSFYFSERRGIDLLGKCDRHIARLPALRFSEDTRPGHNKFDLDYSLGVLKPDLVVGFFELPVDEEEMRRASLSDLPYIGQLYFHPLFRRHCLPYPVASETGRTIFVCDWSTECSGKSEWRKLPVGPTP